MQDGVLRMMSVSTPAVRHDHAAFRSLVGPLRILRYLAIVALLLHALSVMQPPDRLILADRK